MNTILPLFIVLGIIVVIHEFGHYVAARLMGVRVETFSFGFGKRIFGKQIGDTDFRFSLIPLGGYVKMAGEEEWDPDNLKPDEFQAKNRGQKIFILFMGPFMNLLLAFAIFAIINMTGIDVPAYKDFPPRIGYVEKDSPAEIAGIKKGDLILSVDGTAIPDWKKLELTIGSNPDTTLEVEYQRDGKTYNVKVDVKSKSEYHFGDAGLHWDFTTQVGGFSKNSPAKEAGFQEKDLVTAVNGTDVCVFEFKEALNAGGGKEVLLTVKRGDEQKEIPVTPIKVYVLKSQVLKTEKETRKLLDEAGNALPEVEFYMLREKGRYVLASRDIESREKAEKFQKLSTMKFNLTDRYIIGIQMDFYSPTVTKQYGFFASMGHSVKRIVSLTTLVFDSFKKMIVGKLSPKNLSGPIEIAKFSKRAMDSGATNFFMLIAFISLQLGIVNLFPIPALDGGHLMIFSIEAILRKEFSQKVKGILMNFGFLLLLTLMAFVILNDIAKNLPNGWNSFLPF